MKLCSSFGGESLFYLLESKNYLMLLGQRDVVKSILFVEIENLFNPPGAPSCSTPGISSTTHFYGAQD